MVDHDGKGLAGISRELAYLDAQGGRPQNFAGAQARPQRPPVRDRSINRNQSARGRFTGKRHSERRST